MHCLRRIFDQRFSVFAFDAGCYLVFAPAGQAHEKPGYIVALPFFSSGSPARIGAGSPCLGYLLPCSIFSCFEGNRICAIVCHTGLSRITNPVLLWAIFSRRTASDRLRSLSATPLGAKCRANVDFYIPDCKQSAARWLQLRLPSPSPEYRKEEPAFDPFPRLPHRRYSRSVFTETVVPPP